MQSYDCCYQVTNSQLVYNIFLSSILHKRALTRRYFCGQYFHMRRWKSAFYSQSSPRVIWETCCCSVIKYYFGELCRVYSFGLVKIRQCSVCEESSAKEKGSIHIPTGRQYLLYNNTIQLIKFMKKKFSSCRSKERITLRFEVQTSRRFDFKNRQKTISDR